MQDLLNYARRLEEAGLQVVRGVLEEVVSTGLPGEHHFYLTFDPTEQGVEMAPSLREAYPDEMTIVLQHQYDDLEVDEQGFSVVLAFSGVAQRLVVPWSALRRFVDPAASFGLQFGGAPATGPVSVGDVVADGEATGDADVDDAPDEAGPEAAGEVGDDRTGNADVLQFEDFRKR